MTFNAISANKANRLYWLGRYTERVYLSLHLLRRYYDQMIDGHPQNYEEFYEKLDAAVNYSDTTSFSLGYLYDMDNPCSVIAGLEYANDNAIVLRDEISSETLSYIQLSLCKIRSSAKTKDSNITDLQCITDYLLAFWGSIDERVFDERIRNFLKIGRMIENIDMHVRFDYPFYRIKEVYDSLIECAEKDEEVMDKVIYKQLNELIVENVYENQTPEYKGKVLKYLTHLILL